MHRVKWESDDKNAHTKAIHNDVDGSIFKGVEEILREMEDELIAVDKVRMPFRCNKARTSQEVKIYKRNSLHTRSDVLHAQYTTLSPRFL
jgi:hypothetical protein